ncbi:MAG: GntR family transcriptional regulator [Gemmataceae bacterium]
MAGLVRSTREQIIDLMREDILCGRLPEGQRLGEAELAVRFGVSRGPIREALAQLTQEGLLVAKPNCGVKVAPSAPDAIRELIVPIRRTIETYALKLIFADLDGRDFQKWDDILHDMEQACRRKDTAAVVQHDIAFHRSILARAGQEDLLTIWQTLVARVRCHFQRSTELAGRKLTRVHDEHRTLVDVFRAGNRNAAAKALAKHIW